MTYLSIRREGHGWDVYPAVRFHWSAAASEWADEVGPLFRDSLKHRCPVNTRPHFTNQGRLRASITYSRSSSVGNSINVDFHAHTPYAKYVLRGTKPHGIDPVAAKMLHWWDRPAFGREYFARHVEHPGQAANRFPQRAMNEDRGELIRRFTRILEDHLVRALEE